MPKIIYNGNQVEIAPDSTIASLLEERQVKRTHLVIEYNTSILSGKDALEKYALTDGDRISLFSMVGGG